MAWETQSGDLRAALPAGLGGTAVGVVHCGVGLLPDGRNRELVDSHLECARGTGLGCPAVHTPAGTSWLRDRPRETTRL